MYSAITGLGLELSPDLNFRDFTSQAISLVHVYAQARYTNAAAVCRQNVKSAYRIALVSLQLARIDDENEDIVLEAMIDL